MIIGERLKEARMKKGLSQEAIGQKLGVTKVSICGYERGTRTPTMRNFIDLIAILDLDAKYVLGQDINIIMESPEPYNAKLSEPDLIFLKELKRNPELYNKFISNPKETIEIISKKLNIHQK